MELDDSIRQSRNDFGHSLSDLVLPTLINLEYTQNYDAVYEWSWVVKSTPGCHTVLTMSEVDVSSDSV